MDLLARARVLASCRLFGALAPPVVIRLAERAHGREVAIGDRAAGDAVCVIASGRFRVGDEIATAGQVLGMVRVVARARPATATTATNSPASVPPRVATPAIAVEPSTLVELAVDDVRDVLEEDPAALAALADALAALLLGAAAVS